MRNPAHAPPCREENALSHTQLQLLINGDWGNATAISKWFCVIYFISIDLYLYHSSYNNPLSVKLYEICCTICQSWPRSPSSGLQPLKAVSEAITQTAQQSLFHTINGASNDSSGSCRQFILHLPISAENPDPRLYIRAQYAETSQCSEGRQQHGQRKCLQGRPAL